MTETRRICLTQRAISRFIILTAISLIFFSALASALDLELSSPDSVELDEEFIVTISSDASDSYDVKIFVHLSDDEQISRSEYISEIFNEGWKDPWFYLSGTFPSQEDYRIRVISSPGDREICVRLRKTSSPDSGFEQKCYPLEVSSSKKSEEVKEETSKDEKEKEKSEMEESLPPPTLAEPPSSPTAFALNAPAEERIILNPLVQSEDVLITKTNTTRNVLLYSFTAFCVLLLVLVALRKL